MTTLVPYQPLAVQQRLSWRTGILKTYSGLESRICYRKNPRESWSILYAVDLELDRRDLRLALFDDPVSAWRVPLKPYAVPAQDDVTIGSVTIDSTYADWVVANQRVWIEGDDPDEEDDAFATTITGVGGTTSSRVLVLADAPPVGGSFSAGLTRVSPLVDMLLEDAQATARAAPAGSAIETALRDVGAGTWQMQATSAAYRTTWGTGAALTSFDGYYVMDRRPVVESDPEEQYLAELRRFDLGGVVTQQWSKASADIRRSHVLQATGDAERQWLIKFLTSVYGPQVAFLLPTWQPDLDLVAQPIAPYTHLHVYRTPGYQTWFASAAHKHLQLLGEDGSVTYAKATSVVDNMDGTEDVTLSAAVGAGPFERVSLLELARIADDVVDLLHVGDRVDTELRALVVQR